MDARSDSILITHDGQEDRRGKKQKRFRLSYLEYLKAVDVQHAHDLVAGFSLCLQVDKLVNIRILEGKWQGRGEGGGGSLMQY